MFYYRQFTGFLLIMMGFFLFLYAVYDLLWRLAFICIGFILINQGRQLRGFDQVYTVFNVWTDRFRF